MGMRFSLKGAAFLAGGRTIIRGCPILASDYFASL
jgi:hypothetical protein